MSRLPITTFSPSIDPLDNVASFQPRSGQPALSSEDAKQVAKLAGFTSRETVSQAPAIDGRSLRRTNRKAQLNISVSPETKAAFWNYVKENGYDIGEEALLALLAKAAR